MLKKILKNCAAVAKQASEDKLKFIKVSSDGKKLLFTATNGISLIRYEYKSDKKLNGFIDIKKIPTIKDIEDIETVNVFDYPKIKKFHFSKSVIVNKEWILRYCKFNFCKVIQLKVVKNKFILSYKDDTIKTKYKNKTLEGNIKYYRTFIDPFYLKKLLDDNDKKTFIKISVGKSGKEPLKFGNHIIMPNIKGRK